jgi:hypothetical protein
MTIVGLSIGLVGWVLLMYLAAQAFAYNSS